MKIILVGSGNISRDDIPLTTLPAYRQFIRGIVKGCQVIVGRGTFEQPHFHNLLDQCLGITVLSTTLNKSLVKNALISKRLYTALLRARKNSENICIIGGEEIFTKIIDNADKVYYLKVDHAECPTPIKKHGFLLAWHSPNMQTLPARRKGKIGVHQPKITERSTINLTSQCWLPNKRS